MVKIIRFTLYYILFSLVAFIVMDYILNVANECWINRAKNAGYYEVLPDNLKYGA